MFPALLEIIFIHLGTLLEKQVIRLYDTIFQKVT